MSPGAGLPILHLPALEFSPFSLSFNDGKSTLTTHLAELLVSRPLGLPSLGSVVFLSNTSCNREKGPGIGRWTDIRATHTPYRVRVPLGLTPTASFKINQLIEHLSGCSLEKKERSARRVGELVRADQLVGYLTCDNDEELVMYLRL